MGLGLLSPLLFLLLCARLDVGSSADRVPVWVPAAVAALAVPYAGVLGALGAVCARNVRPRRCCAGVSSGAAFGFVLPLVLGPVGLGTGAVGLAALLSGAVLIAAASAGGWRFGRWSLERAVTAERPCG